MTYTLYFVTGDINGKEASKAKANLSRHDVKVATEAFKTILETQFQVPVLATYGKNGDGEETTFTANLDNETNLLGKVLVVRDG